MPRIHNKELVLVPTTNVNPAVWDESKYDAFVDELCPGREYQKEAIFATLRFLLSGKYRNLRELARENYDEKPKLHDAYGSWGAMEARLQFPDALSCSLDLATGTGKSYVLYALSAIMLAEGVVDRVLTLCPSLTIEKGLTEKFREMAAQESLREVMPESARYAAPGIVNATETVTEGCICIENYHATLNHVRSSIRDSFAGKGARTLVLNDETHHVATRPSGIQNWRWKEFLLKPDFGFRYIVGVSGTCYLGNDYFADVVSCYSLREAIEERVVKNVEYVAEAPRVANPDERWQLIYQQHRKNLLSLKSRRIRPLTIIVTAGISKCKVVAEDLCAFLCEQEGLSADEAKGKVLVVTSSKEHQRNIARLSTVDRPQSKVEWIISVSMLTEGWDVKNVFQIVPHEERAFNSKLLIAQVLGRGLRVPDAWQGEQPLVSVFNHDAWSGRIAHLVDEILDIEQRVSSVVVADSPHHFDLHNLEYDRQADEKAYRMKGEYALFKDGFIDLPTVTAEEPVDIGYERVRGGPHTVKAVIRHKSFTAAEVAKDMHENLLALDRENALLADPRKHTGYAKKYPMARLEAVVQESVNRARINAGKIPDEEKQKMLGALNVLRRDVSKRITYRTEARGLLLQNTCERQAVSCSAAELLSGRKKVFYHSDSRRHLIREQMDFFEKLLDEDGGFSGGTAKIENNYNFKSPVNLAIADHEPEFRFVRRLCEPENASAITAWIKNTDMGFYSIEYAWSKEGRVRRVSHVKRGAFNPDFFIKQDGNIFVVEIKDDGEAQDPSRENSAKCAAAVAHFALLNKWLAGEHKTRGVKYHFNMLTPQDYPAFFEKMRDKDLAGFRSHLDVEIARRTGNSDADFGELDIVKIITAAYEGEGLMAGEKGTVVMVHTANGKTAYEVEFDGWKKMFPVKVKTLTGDEIELVEKWRG
ncbi:MAG: DEAD/DEAH box helicase family protein [Gammaproteobacteria bacterium]